LPSWPASVFKVRMSGSMSVPVDVAAMVSVELNEGDDVPIANTLSVLLMKRRDAESMVFPAL